MAKAEPKQAPFEFGGSVINAGSHALVDLPVGRLSNHTPVNLPVHIFHGRRVGPVLFVSAAIHGDEIIGVEIIRRLMASKVLRGLRGTLMCIPIVNAFGFITQSRYLPDRRDLNRSFPGAERGPLGGQIARLFVEEIVKRCDLGIDLHSGAINRSNLPQLRGDFENADVRAVADAFGAPVMLHSRLRPGSLREAAQQLGVNVLLYEAGEALRLDEMSVRIGVKGVLNVMQHLGMTRRRQTTRRIAKSVVSKTSGWVRAEQAGLFGAFKNLGEHVGRGEILGSVSNPYEGTQTEVAARFSGIIIGRTNISVVNRADALFHLARVPRPEDALGKIDKISGDIQEDPIFDDDELV